MYIENVKSDSLKACFRYYKFKMVYRQIVESVKKIGATLKERIELESFIYSNDWLRVLGLEKARRYYELYNLDHGDLWGKMLKGVVSVGDIEWYAEQTARNPDSFMVAAHHFRRLAQHYHELGQTEKAKRMKENVESLVCLHPDYYFFLPAIEHIK